MTSSPDPAAARSRGRSALRLIGLILLALLALVLGLGAGLETPWGMKAAANLALRLAHPWRGAELAVAGARGGFITGIELHGIRVRRADGSFEAEVDTLIVRYHVSELIGPSRRVRELVVAGANASATLPLKGEPGAKKPGSPPDFTLDRIGVRRVSATLRVRPAGRDSVLEVGGLALAISALRVTRTVSLALDTLTASLRAPAAPPATLRLAAAGRLAPGRMEVRTLTLGGERTRVTGAGALALPTPQGIHIASADFRLRFAPLAGGDIRRFVPALGDPGDVTLDLAARGADSTLDLTMMARAERGGHANLVAHLPAHGGALVLRTEGRIRDLDLGAIAGASLQRLVLSASWNADLSGQNAAHISGPLSLDLAGTRVGATRLEAASLAGRFDDGRVTMRLGGAANGFDLAATGWVTPLSVPPACDLEGKLGVPPIFAAGGRPALVAGAMPFHI